MALTLTEGASLGMPFAHATDDATGTQIPLVALHPDSPGVGGGGGGTAEAVVIRFVDGLTQVSVSEGNPLPVTNEAVGAVDDAPVVDPDAATASLAALLRGVLAALVEYDSVGAPLPPEFGSAARTMTYTGGDLLQTESVTVGGTTWVKTYTYTGSNLTGISGWVEQ